MAVAGPFGWTVSLRSGSKLPLGTGVRISTKEKSRGHTRGSPL